MGSFLLCKRYQWVTAGSKGLAVLYLSHSFPEYPHILNPEKEFHIINQMRIFILSQWY